MSEATTSVGLPFTTIILKYEAVSRESHLTVRTMSQSVIPQVDVGSLTLKGLSAFAPLLAALTADNVAPTTMIQLENLGTLFHINGPYAARVPDLLRRCSSVHVDQMAMSIGWRKGDAASIMAQSSGGQAVALLCFCIANTCEKRNMGTIIYDLSEAVLARSLSVHSSISQLEDAANLLAGKLQVIGFGNILAEHVVKIHDVYTQLEIPLPRHFYEFMTRESMVEFFHHLTIVFEQKDAILRITGTHTMGHIVTTLLLMFPDSVMLTIEGFLVREGPHVSVIIEIDSAHGKDQPTTMQIENKLVGSAEHPINLEFTPSAIEIPYTFRWSGHIADALELEFINSGFRCSNDFKTACCNFLMSSLSLQPCERSSYVSFPGGTLIPRGSLLNLVGSEPILRMSRVCSEMFRTGPPETIDSASRAYTNLSDAFDAIIGTRAICTCSSTPRCAKFRRWYSAYEIGKRAETCRLYRLWRSVSLALGRAYYCLLIDAQPDSVCVLDVRLANSGSLKYHPAAANMSAALYDGEGDILDSMWCEEVDRHLMDLVGTREEKYPCRSLARCNGASTILPAPLLDLHVNLEQGYRYKLFDGQLLIKGRYHRDLKAVPVRSRSQATTSLTAREDGIRPSSIGEHDQLSFTLREGLSCLELRTSILVRGQSVHVDIGNIMLGAMGLENAPACDHDILDMFSFTFEPNALVTSIATIKTEGRGGIAIVQTMGNPTAQFLACDKGFRSVLQRRCCIDCAVQHARKRMARQIVVAV